MPSKPSPNALLEILLDTLLGLVRGDVRDPTARQLAVFLVCSLDKDRDHTVRGLAADLKLSKAAVTRSIDRLEISGLARRKPDPADRRSVLVSPTIQGSAFLKNLRGIMVASAKQRGVLRV